MNNKSNGKFQMKTSITLVSICCVVAAGLLTACNRKSVSGLGPMPSEKDLPDPLARQTAGQMRTWIQNLKPADAEKLKRTGSIIFSWEELKAAYPEQAGMIGDYLEHRRVSMVEAIQKQSQPIPAGLAAHFNPVTVEFAEPGTGGCWLRITSRTGIEHEDLVIAAAR